MPDIREVSLLAVLPPSRATAQNARISRGEPLRMDFSWASPGEDITDWTLAFTLAAARNDEDKLIEVEPEILDAEAGTFRVDLDTDDTDLEPATYWWDVWRVDDGEENLLAIGRLFVSSVVRLP